MKPMLLKILTLLLAGLLSISGFAAPAFADPTVLEQRTFTIIPTGGSGGAGGGVTTSEMIMSDGTVWQGGAVGVQGGLSQTNISQVGSPVYAVPANVAFKFDIGSAVDSLNTTYGIGEWTVENVQLSFQYTLYANNSRFGAGDGDFNIYWVEKDDWVYSSDQVWHSTDAPYVSTVEDLTAWAWNAELLAEPYYSWTTPNYTGTYDDLRTTSWATDKLGDRQSTMDISLGLNSLLLQDILTASAAGDSYLSLYLMAANETIGLCIFTGGASILPTLSFDVVTPSSSEDVDTDGDGLPDSLEADIGTDPEDDDTDDDGTSDYDDQCPSDAAKIEPGTCGCGVADTDTDGDGTPDCNDQCPNDAAKTEPGICGCGVAEGTCDEELTAPTLLAPVSGMVVTTLTPTLAVYNSTTSADYYTFEIYDATDALVYTQDVTPGQAGTTSLAIPSDNALADEVDYSWQVKAVALSGSRSSAWMPARFSVDTGSTATFTTDVYLSELVEPSSSEATVLAVTEDQNSPVYGVEVEIPAGAITEAASFTVGVPDEQEVDLPEGYDNIFLLHLGPGGVTFEQPITIRMPYSKTEGKTPVILTRSDGSAEWSTITPTSITSTEVLFEVTHFSIFAVAEEITSNSSSSQSGGGGGGGGGCFITTVIE